MRTMIHLSNVLTYFLNYHQTASTRMSSLIPRRYFLSKLTSSLAVLAGIWPVITPLPCRADTFHFDLVTGPEVYTVAPPTTPRRAPLFAKRPPQVTKLPPNLVNPYFAFIPLWPNGKEIDYVALVQFPPNKPPILIVDGDLDGDLTNDPSVQWKTFPYKAANGQQLTRYEGDAVLHVHYSPDHVVDLPMHFILPDPNDPNAAAYGQYLIYLPDYIRKGELILNNVKYTAYLYDLLARGDFKCDVSASFPGSILLIDVNHNGKIDARGEIYRADRPFNIGGITYQLTIPDYDGSTVIVERSPKSVPEILPPPDLSVGQIAPSFTATTLKGNIVHFPQDYHGKRVLLYFWGSWCPHCRAQLPYVTAAYKKYHSKGLEILGICIEPANYRDQLMAFLKAHHITWPQVYDGKYWETAEAQLYFIHIVPYPILIDGDSGRILAGREQLLGPELDKTLAHFLSTPSSAVSSTR